MKVLVANIGSTSLKWRLFNFSNGQEDLMHRGGFERVTDYPKAIADCLTALRYGGHIEGDEDLAAVGFKTVVAKGVSGCVRLDEPVLKAMEALNGLAPAHNPPYITGIRLFAQRMPRTPLVGLFETAFYQWAPEARQRYAVPRAWHDAGVRRHGFHGASHKFIAERSAELLGREDVAKRARRLYVSNDETAVRSPALRVISCHLGGSSSVTGIRNGAAVGTSMGFSPQSGLPQNDRVGDLDSFAIPYMMRAHGLSLDEVERQMCKESGLKGLSRVSNDIRDILSQADQGNQDARLALDVLIEQTRHWIGVFLVALNGADALVFTAGIGENHPSIREAVCRDLDQLGITLNSELNSQAKAKEAVISAAGSRAKVMIIPTNEELVVAREVKRFLENSRN